MRFAILLLAVLPACSVAQQSNLLAVQSGKERFIIPCNNTHTEAWHRKNLLPVSLETEWYIKEGVSVDGLNVESVGEVAGARIVRLDKRLSPGIFYDSIVVRGLERPDGGLLPFFRLMYRSAPDVRIEEVAVSGNTVSIAMKFGRGPAGTTSFRIEGGACVRVDW